MSYTLSDLGTASRLRGAPQRALEYWARARTIRRDAVAADSKNVRAVFASASIAMRMGHLLGELGRFPEALPLRREALSAYDQLLALGRTPSRERDAAFGRLGVADALLGGREAGLKGRPWSSDEARRLIESVRPAQVLAPGQSTPDPEFRSFYDELVARLEPRP